MIISKTGRISRIFLMILGGGLPWLIYEFGYSILAIDIWKR